MSRVGSEGSLPQATVGQKPSFAGRLNFDPCWTIAGVISGPSHMSIAVTFTYGILVIRQALQARGVSLAEVCNALEVAEPMDSGSSLLSFGPAFGKEASDALVRRLQGLGLTYVDDFFDIALDLPEWVRFSASSNEQPVD